MLPVSLGRGHNGAHFRDPRLEEALGSTWESLSGESSGLVGSSSCFPSSGFHGLVLFFNFGELILKTISKLVSNILLYQRATFRIS